jgi:hypothetical protein
VDEHVRNLQSLSKENALLKDKLRDMATENHEVSWLFACMQGLRRKVIAALSPDATANDG